MRGLTWRRRGAIALATLVVGVAVPATASAYWDFTGYLYAPPTIPHEYGKTHVKNYDYWYIRVKRSNCNAKTQVYDRDTGWIQILWPGGCDTTDYTYGYSAWYYYASRSRNTENSKVWVNVRIQLSV